MSYEIIEASSPIFVGWFIDRVGDMEIYTNFMLDFEQNNNSMANITNNINILNTYVNIVVDPLLQCTAEQQNCCICMENKENTQICHLSCSHTFCIECSRGHLASQQRNQFQFTCPLCREEIQDICIQNEKDTKMFCIQ